MHYGISLSGTFWSLEMPLQSKHRKSRCTDKDLKVVTLPTVLTWFSFSLAFFLFLQDHCPFAQLCSRQLAMNLLSENAKVFQKSGRTHESTQLWGLYKVLYLLIQCNSRMGLPPSLYCIYWFWQHRDRERSLSPHSMSKHERTIEKVLLTWEAKLAHHP